MLDAALAGVRRLGRGNRDRNVAGKGNSLLLRFVGNGEIRVARQMAINLDEVGAVAPQ